MSAYQLFERTAGSIPASLSCVRGYWSNMAPRTVKRSIIVNCLCFCISFCFYQFINSLSYNWPGTIDRLNHLLNCSADYNALVGLVSANDGVQVIQFPRWPGILFHDQKAWKSSEIWNNCERPLQWKPTHARAFSSWSKLSFRPAFFPFHTATEKVRLVSIDWLLACIAERKSYQWHNSR